MKVRRPAAAGDEGFALLVVMGSMVVLTILLLSTLSFALRNMAPSRADQDSKAATAAAQAGVEEYLARLNANDTYWMTTDCTNLALVPTPPATCATPRPATGVAVPGTTGVGTYSYRVLSNTASTTRDGLVRLAVTGFSRGKKRSLVAELAPTGFLQYIYFTDFEVMDPALTTELADPASDSSLPTARLNGQKFLKNSTAMTYTLWYPRRSGTAGPCGSQHWYSGRSAPQYSSGKYLEYVYRYSVDGSGNDVLTGRLSGPTERDASSTAVISDFTCEEIQFPGGDKITGPLKTNDAMLLDGPVHFTSPITETAWSTAPDPTKPWRGPGTPSPGTTAEPGYQPRYGGALPMPDSNAELITAATTSSAGCVYTGTTRIEFLSSGKMSVRSPGTSGAVPRCYPGGSGPATVDVPSVLYVKESTASCWDQLGYPLPAEVTNLGAGPDYGCKRGNAYISGVFKGRLTIGTENDVVVVGDTTYAGGMTGGDALGLIPQNFAWIYHPVKSNQDPLLATPVRKLDAAVLAVQHSFLVQNWRVGAKLSTATDESSKLQVRGSIAQKYRGPVGAGGATGAGYFKAYTYDKRLLHVPPPYFLRPQTSPYVVLRITD